MIVLLNLLNELEKRDKMLGSLRIFMLGLLSISFHNELNIFTNTRAAVDGIPSQIPAFLPITFTLGSRSHKM